MKILGWKKHRVLYCQLKVCKRKGLINMGQNYTSEELLACVMSRYIEDGENVAAGANALVPQAAALIAHFHHGPNMRVAIGQTWCNVFNTPMVQIGSITDYRAYRGNAEYCRHHEEGFDRAFFGRKKGAFSTFFAGAIQVDKYGNLNMFGVGGDYQHLKFRGPGIIGLSHCLNFMHNIYIYVTNHNKRLFVDKLDYVSAIGYGDGPAFRGKWFLPGPGPKLCISPMAIMDFDEETKRMRLKSVHPGFSVDEIIENTGFELITPKNIPTTDLPTDEELHILRTRVDPAGLLSRSKMGT